MKAGIRRQAWSGTHVTGGGYSRARQGFVGHRVKGSTAAVGAGRLASQAARMVRKTIS
jgi:hypothetical protein